MLSSHIPTLLSSQFVIGMSLGSTLSASILSSNQTHDTPAVFSHIIEQYEKFGLCILFESGHFDLISDFCVITCSPKKKNAHQIYRETRWLETA